MAEEAEVTEIKMVFRFTWKIPPVDIAEVDAPRMNEILEEFVRNAIQYAQYQMELTPEQQAYLTIERL